MATLTVWGLELLKGNCPRSLLEVDSQKLILWISEIFFSYLEADRFTVLLSVLESIVWYFTHAAFNAGSDTLRDLLPRHTLHVLIGRREAGLKAIQYNGQRSRLVTPSLFILDIRCYCRYLGRILHVGSYYGLSRLDLNSNAFKLQSIPMEGEKRKDERKMNGN